MKIALPDLRAGISVGLIDDIPTCNELVRRIVNDAEDTIKGLHTKIIGTRESKL
jgi:NAD(P)H-dependent flavin oxidoreductase YrpB (nitropropane dioxygenase family)